MRKNWLTPKLEFDLIGDGGDQRGKETLRENRQNWKKGEELRKRGNTFA